MILYWLCILDPGHDGGPAEEEGGEKINPAVQGKFLCHSSVGVWTILPNC